MSDFLVRIYYEDTDCGGIVYHTNYIKYCERARSEIFFSVGILPNTERVGLVVRKLNAEFLDSAKLGDLLKVKTRILKLGGSSLTLLQEIYKCNLDLENSPSLARGNSNNSPSLARGNSNNSPSLAEGARGWVKSSLQNSTQSTKIFQCEVKLACIDIEHKKIVKIPNEILAILKAKFSRISNGK